VRIFNFFKILQYDISSLKTKAKRYIENLFLVSETDMVSQEDESTTRFISSIDILT